MSRIGIFTNNFRFYHDVIDVAKNWELPYFSIDPSSSVPVDIPVILSTTADPEIDNRQVKENDPVRALRLGLPRLIDQIEFRRIVIGIDPGPKPGVAVICDDVLTEATELPEIMYIEEYILKVLSDYSYGGYSIRIGDGDTPNREKITDILSRNRLSYVVVDESNTTIFRHRPQNNAISAAVIGMARSKDTRSSGKGDNFLDERFVTIRNSI